MQAEARGHCLDFLAAPVWPHRTNHRREAGGRFETHRNLGPFAIRLLQQEDDRRAAVPAADLSQQAADVPASDVHVPVDDDEAIGWLA